MKGGIYRTKYGWQVRFGRKLTKHFKDLGAAERFLTGVRFKSDEGTFDIRDYKSDNPLGFENQVEKWLKYKAKTNITTRTLKTLERDIGRATAYFGQKNVKTITSGEVEDFVYSDHLTPAGNPIASKTRHNIASALGQFFNWVGRREKIHIPDIPAVSFELGWRNITDVDTQQRIIAKVREIAPNIKVFLGIKWLAENPNVRPGEMVRIKEGDIFLNRGIVLVRKTKEVRKNAKYFVLDETDIEILKTLPKSLPDIPFFRHQKSRSGIRPGTPFGPTMFNKSWQRAAKNLGVEGVSLYGGTKHTTVTALGELLSPEEIKRGGTEHQTNKAFERYMLPDIKDKLKVRSAIKKLRDSNKPLNDIVDDKKIVKLPK